MKKKRSIHQVIVRLDSEALSLLKQVCSRMGVSQVDVMRLGLRLLAQREMPEKFAKTYS